MSKYIELKRKGKFYEVKHEDAYILWYLLRYKIHNNKVSSGRIINGIGITF